MTENGKTLPARRRQPWQIFSSSATPAGLYARQKWLGEEQTPSWQQDFEQTVAALRHGQQASGLWQDSPLATIHNLFGLHLTVREADPAIHRALDALQARAQQPLATEDENLIAGEELTGLPFMAARWGDILIPAVLFLSAIFGRSSAPQVIAQYSRIASDLSASGLGAAAPSRVHNCFRALVVHPDYAGHETTRKAVAWYARRQTSEGDWGAEIPFYQTLNALAHLDTTVAEDQCQAAFATLPARQNTDGSWGQQQPEWHTFLTLHALRNKGRLSLP